MIWDDPWIAAATDRSSRNGLFCTRLPPPVPTMPAGMTFRCVQTMTPDAEWLALVGTRWSPKEAAARLVDSWVPLLRDEEGRLVGTCVLRNQSGSVWLLETLRSVRYGTLLMRSVMTWIYQQHGPFILGYTWELTAVSLAYAWWRGWMASAVAIEYGWAFSEGCGFCPTDSVPAPPVLLLPTLMRTEHGWAIVNDSGLRDGWGHVVAWDGIVDWVTVAKRGGFRSLWMRGKVSTAPPQWRWTGEFVVVGMLNACQPETRKWITAEI